MERTAVTRAGKGCKRCGSKNVAWHQSERGKWYLIEVFDSPSGGYSVGNNRDFHSTYCNKPGEHHAMQARLDAEFQEEEEERQARAGRREDERIAEEAQKMRDFIALNGSERQTLIVGLYSKLDRLKENYVTMDYMTEHMRWVAECEGLRTEIDFYLDFYLDLNDDLEG